MLIVNLMIMFIRAVSGACTSPSIANSSYPPGALSPFDAGETPFCPSEATMYHVSSMNDAGQEPDFSNLYSVDATVFGACTAEDHPFPDAAATEDCLAVKFGDSIPRDDTFEKQLGMEPTISEAPSGSEAAVSGDIIRPYAASEVPAEFGESSIRLRRRVIARALVDDPEDEAYENDNFVADDAENFDDEYRVDVETAPQKGRAARKFNKSENEKGNPTRKRKKANNSADHSVEKPPKKFSHSTRRNKRQVDKVLLETPADEIDPQKLRIKDLIMLAEFRERHLNKQAATSRTLLMNQSGGNSFPVDAADNREQTYNYEQGGDMNNHEAGPVVSEPSINYHSFMNRAPRVRWSTQDTELFYEAIRQFGTDFSMIQQLFPDRTRQQVKLKFKKEERHHPLRLFAAVNSRAKDFSHFEMIMKRLQEVASQTEQDLCEEDSVGVVGDDNEVEEIIPEKSGKAAMTEQKEEAVEKEEDTEAHAAEVHSPEKSAESDEDDFLRWNAYKSDI